MTLLCEEQGMMPPARTFLASAGGRSTMYHHSRRRSACDATDRAVPSEAWLFAQTILGNRIPDLRAAAQRSRHNRELLELAASISDSSQDELCRPKRDEAQARRDREQLEWLASISEVHERELGALEREESEARKAKQEYERINEALGIEEARWDPAKHPRRGTPPNPGWFAPTGGASSGATPPSTRQLTGFHPTGTGSKSVTSTRTAAAPTAVRVDTTQEPNSHTRSKVPTVPASYSGPKGVVAQQVSTRSGVGHHWAPFSVVFDDEIRRLLADEAVEYAMGAYSGPTSPSHRNASYGGLTHTQYNDLVKKELKKFIKQRKIKKMTANQMQEFVQLINSGRNASGKPDPRIAAFNKAIRKALPKGTKAPSTMDEILAAGRKYMKSSRFRLLAAGAVVAGVLSEVVNQQVKVLDVASTSGHYKRAMLALQDGDLARAHALLLGDQDSLYMEILGRVGALAALNFKKAIEKVFESARDRDYK
jgi:hypothetical protein